MASSSMGIQSYADLPPQITPEKSSAFLYRISDHMQKNFIPDLLELTHRSFNLPLQDHQMQIIIRGSSCLKCTREMHLGLSQDSDPQRRRSQSNTATRDTGIGIPSIQRDTVSYNTNPSNISNNNNNNIIITNTPHHYTGMSMGERISTQPTLIPNISGRGNIQAGPSLGRGGSFNHATTTTPQLAHNLSMNYNLETNNQIGRQREHETAMKRALAMQAGPSMHPARESSIGNSNSMMARYADNTQGEMGQVTSGQSHIDSAIASVTPWNFQVNASHLLTTSAPFPSPIQVPTRNIQNSYIPQASVSGPYTPTSYPTPCTMLNTPAGPALAGSFTMSPPNESPVTPGYFGQPSPKYEYRHPAGEINVINMPLDTLPQPQLGMYGESGLLPANPQHSQQKETVTSESYGRYKPYPTAEDRAKGKGKQQYEENAPTQSSLSQLQLDNTIFRL